MALYYRKYGALPRTYGDFIMIRFCQAGDLDTICRIAKDAWEKIFDHLENAFGKELYNKVNPDCRNSKTPWLHKFFAEHPDWCYITASQIITLIE